MKELLSKITNSTEQTYITASEFSKILVNGDFVALYGDLGAGKTAFVLGIISSRIPECEFAGSPTYALVNEYENDEIKISHFDMYRIKDEDDLYSIGFYDYTDGVVITEWSENIPYALPDKRYEVHIDKISEGERKITITQTE